MQNAGAGADEIGALEMQAAKAAFQPGKAWVFDDTIEHEAWNESDKLRVVLIFDIWHPHLTAPERP